MDLWVRWKPRSSWKGCILALSLLFILGCGKKGAPQPKLPSPQIVVTDLKGEVRDGILLLSFSLPSNDTSKILGFRVSKEEISASAVNRREWEIEFGSKGKYTVYGRRIFFMDEDLTPGSTYSYVIHLFGPDRGLLGSSNNFKIVWMRPPDPLDTFQIHVGDENVRLTWEEEEGYMYNIYRYERGKYSIFPLNSVPVHFGEYTDWEIPGDGDYVYEVRRVRKEGNILVEGEGRPIGVKVTLRKKPKSPFSVKAELKDFGIKITWDYACDPRIHGFYVYRVSSRGVEKLNGTPIFLREFLDLSYPHDPYLLYFVRSVDERGIESEDSNSSVVILGEE